MNLYEVLALGVGGSGVLAVGLGLRPVEPLQEVLILSTFTITLALVGIAEEVGQ